MSARPEARVSEPPKNLENVDLPTRPVVEESEATSDLNREELSTRFETEPTVLLTDLIIESCSVTAVVEPIEANRFSVLPVKRELARVRNPVNVLTYENFSASVEVAPIEMVRVLGKDLPIEPIRANALDRDLKREVCRKGPGAILKDTVSDLNNEVVSAYAEL